MNISGSATGGRVTLGTSPTFHFICYIVPYMNIYGLGVGISLVSKFSNRRGRVTQGTPPIFHLISYIDPYMNIYCFGVGILTVSKFSNRRVGMTTGTSLIFHLICYIVLIHEYIWFRGKDLDHFQVLKQEGEQ